MTIAIPIPLEYVCVFHLSVPIEAQCPPIIHIDNEMGFIHALAHVLIKFSTLKLACHKLLNELGLLRTQHKLVGLHTVHDVVDFLELVYPTWYDTVNEGLIVIVWVDNGTKSKTKKWGVESNLERSWQLAKGP